LPLPSLKRRTETLLIGVEEKLTSRNRRGEVVRGRYAAIAAYCMGSSKVKKTKNCVSHAYGLVFDVSTPWRGLWQKTPKAANIATALSASRPSGLKKCLT
jgi:hypothetical protein